jgi:hypothetical protein
MALNRNFNNNGMERFIRGMAGLLMVVDGLSHRRKFEVGIGAALFLYGITGSNSLMNIMRRFNLWGPGDSLVNLFKQVIPGQGINPILTQQASPKKKPNKEYNESSFVDATSIR